MYATQPDHPMEPDCYFPVRLSMNVPQTGLTASDIRYSLWFMHSEALNPIERRASLTRSAAGAFSAVVAFLTLCGGAFGQAPAVTEQATVPTSYANVHSGPSTNASILVLVPEGTVLPVIGRRGEWVQVQLSPELRQTGIVVRWYEGRHSFMNDGEIITIGDEDSGWMHDSTVEITPVEA